MRTPIAGERSGPLVGSETPGRVRSPVRRTAIHLIETYRREVSPRLGASCRFKTSCSTYGLHAFEHHSAPVALAMTVGRLARCHGPVHGTVRGRGQRPALARSAAVLALVALVVVGIPLAAGQAGAQVTGDCTATLAGVSAASASTPATAVKVDYDSQVVAAGSMPEGPVAYEVQLEFASIRWTVASGTADGSSWSGTVDVATYARYGVGIYKVHAVSVSPARQCVVDAYVEVTGKNPLTSAAGAAAAVATGAGVAMLAASGLAAAREQVVAADEPMPDAATPASVNQRLMFSKQGCCGALAPIAMVMTAASELRGIWKGMP